MRGSYYCLPKGEPTKASQKTVFDSLTVCQLGRHAPQPDPLGQEEPAHPQRGKLLKNALEDAQVHQQRSRQK